MKNLLDSTSRTITQLFEEQVNKTPAQTAIVYQNQTLSYQQLNEKANQLAHHLKKLGVKTDTGVAIAINRSPLLVISLLGVLKAGGTYVPLDPDYPVARLQYILANSQASVLITQSSLKSLFNKYSGVLFSIDDNIAMQQESTSNLHTPIFPNALAYIIYTSGSTGKPKGVMITHENLINVLASFNQELQLTNHDQLLAVTTIAFDIAGLEIYLPLLSGSCIILADKKIMADVLALDALIRATQPTFIQATPTFWQMLLNQGWVPPAHLCLLCGGEAASLSLLQNLTTKAKTIWNVYGPTETTIWSSYQRLSKEVGKQVSIGRPIQNTQFYILDQLFQMVPAGVTGELYISGKGLARGYYQQPDLTAERFIPNPFAQDAQAVAELRLYRTGDLARYLADGNIEFLGRSDDQVKIRGFRIELGEIETTLQSLAAVTHAAVVARQDQNDSLSLIAYVVPANRATYAWTPHANFTSQAGVACSVLQAGTDEIELTQKLKQALSQSLPDYMVPAFFIYVDQLPLTPNGKLDRQSLPAPDLALLPREEYVAPQTPLEQELCAIWSGVLKIKTIGIQDNFFQLGGHSLLATQVIARIRRRYELDIPVRALFDGPTIAQLSQRVAANDHKRANKPLLLPMQRADAIPLSFAQQRLWFLDQLLPEVAVYHIPLAFHLQGALNLRALEKAFNHLLQRHESLRTVFRLQDGEAWQVVIKNVTIDLAATVEELGHLPAQEQKAAIERIQQQAARTPFQLATGPLFRVRVLALAPEEFILLITFHHIVVDGWSVGVFYKELAALYQAEITGQPAALPPLPVQYVDFTLWQRQWLQGEVLEQQLAYWRKQLAGIPDLLLLPTDQPRPKEPSYQGGIYRCELTGKTKAELQALAVKHQASLYMVLLAAFQILLYRYSGQNDIVVGSPIANRQEQALEPLIGFFVNTLSIRTKLASQATFIEVLKQVKETTLQAYQHQDVPFEQLVDHLQVAREFSRNPVFQVLFTFQSLQEQPSLVLTGLNITSLPVSNLASKFDLSCTAYEHSDSIGIEIEYATDLFVPATIVRLASHFKLLIDGILIHPEQAIGDYPLLTPLERHQLVEQWNASSAAYPAQQSIHSLFEEQVLKTPQQIALVYEGQTLTYQQLNAKANQLAHYLRKQGVGLETPVAMAVERSLAMVISLLAVLKVGGTYVPLDLNYPTARLQFMLDDTQAPVLITTSQISKQDFIENFTGKIITLDKDHAAIQKEVEINFPAISSANSAYVIYTSGSTGKPKGVLAKHASVVNCVYAIKEMANISANETFLALTSLSFDVSALDYYLPLFTGSKIVLCSEDDQKDGFKLIKLMQDYAITCIQGTPSLFRMILATQQQWQQKIKIMLAGEALPEDLIHALKRNNQVFNIYGPTEGTVYSTFLEISHEKHISIGRPIKNTKAYILDECQNPVPMKITGELYIGGVNLAFGYLNRPDITAEKFVPNPFITAEEAKHGINLRLYKTGDLARYLFDGNIEYLGRIDDQVKIRGFRIELQEIESALINHSSVLQAIVILKEEKPGDKKLVAYVVPKNIDNDFIPATTLVTSSDYLFSMLKENGMPILSQRLKEYLSRLLPSYMVPQFFVYLSQIPLTSNKKIDRGFLRTLALPSTTNNQMLPQTILEKELLAIWSAVLKVEQLGANDNFFNVGGDSIISIQLVSKARSKGIYFTAKDIFTHPTIASLATVATIEQKAPTLLPEQKIITGELPLTPIQLWFFENNLIEINHYNQAVLLSTHEKIDVNILNQAFSFLLSHHDALRLRYFKDEAGQWKQKYRHNDDNSVCNLINLTNIPKYNLLDNIREKALLIQQQLHIEKGPIIKAALFACGELTSMYLLIAIHHLAVDGVSWRILLEDLETLYLQLLTSKKASLPAKTHSYQQWGSVLQTYAYSSQLKAEVPYWQAVLNAIEMLPIDFKQATETAPATATIIATLTSQETMKLIQVVPLAYKTEINDILLTALALCISDWTGKSSVTFSLEGHGREDIHQEIDLARTVGWFTSLFPVNITIDDTTNLSESIKSVKKTLRKIPCKGIGYGILKYMTTTFAATHCPQPTINFNYLGQWDNIVTQSKLFSFSTEPGIEGECISNKNRFPYLLDINCEVKAEVLQFYWTYSCHHYHRQTVEKLATSFINKLKQLIEHCCRNDNNFNYTAADFDLIKLSSIENDLRNVLETL